MTGRQNTAALAAATQRRTEDAKKRTRQAVKRLRTRGVAATFRAVAIEAKVSRDFLYRNPDMRALVVGSRATTTSTGANTASRRLQYHPTDAGAVHGRTGPANSPSASSTSTITAPPTNRTRSSLTWPAH